MKNFEELKVILARILAEYEERTSEIIGCELEANDGTCYSYNGEKFGRGYKRNMEKH